MLDKVSSAERLASQRVAAAGTLAVGFERGRTRIRRLHQEGAAKIRMPHVVGEPLEVILINTAGGMTGGDRLRWGFDLDAGAAVSVTTQACEKGYRSNAGHAEIITTASLRAGAHLSWLPQETILYDGAQLRRRLEVDLAPGATLLALESTIFGRTAMGERVVTAIFRDDWRIKVDGRLLHAEAFAIGPDVAGALPRRAVTGGAVAVATLLLVAPDAAERLDAVRSVIGDAGSASAWSVGGTGKLLARLVAKDGHSLRSALMPLVALLNGRAGLPKVWSI